MTVRRYSRTTARGWLRGWRWSGLARRLREEVREEDGQTLLLGIGLTAIVLAFLLVFASSAAVYLDLKRLTSLADLAAVQAADTIDDATYYSGQGVGGSSISLTPQGVISSVDAAVRSQALASSTRFHGLNLVDASTDGRSVRVTLSARSQPPFLPWGIIPSEGIPITTTSSALLTTTP